MKHVYGYVRVSTKKQGDGVSLEVQQDVIEKFAHDNDLVINKWFIEKKSASKGFRPEFSRMMADLYDKKAKGFIAHKIDRMMRNRTDWASLNYLIDEGYEIHSATESIDFNEPSGRFMADIQAANATHYSFNLSREAKKGLYGRLKQGLYPFYAPLGYLDNGKGKVKTIDPIRAPLIKQIFTLYIKKRLSVRQLVKKMDELGLKNRNGNPLVKNSILAILKNPFYMGIMKVKNECYQGKHEPLIPYHVYIETQEILSGKKNARKHKHNYLYSRVLTCQECGYKLIGEKQRGHIYYRCHTKGCTTKSVNELHVNRYLGDRLSDFQLTPEEAEFLYRLNHQHTEAKEKNYKEQIQSVNLQLGHTEKKFNRITDLVIDCVINEDEYKKKKERLVIQQRALLNQKQEIESGKDIVSSGICKFLEHCIDLKKSYDLADIDEKRKMLVNLTSNIEVLGKKLYITTELPYSMIVNTQKLLEGGLTIPRHRNLSHKIIYDTSTNTSPIPRVPMNKKLCRKFFKCMKLYIEDNHHSK